MTKLSDCYKPQKQTPEQIEKFRSIQRESYRLPSLDHKDEKPAVTDKSQGSKEWRKTKVPIGEDDYGRYMPAEKYFTKAELAFIQSVIDEAYKAGWKDLTKLLIDRAVAESDDTYFIKIKKTDLLVYLQPKEGEGK